MGIRAGCTKIAAAVAILAWLPAGEARAANGAYAVDAADIGEAGSCKVESWLSSASNTDPGWRNVHLGFWLDRGTRFSIAARAAGEHAQLNGLERIDHAGWIGDRRKIGVGCRRQPALDLARAGLANIGRIDRIGAIRRPRLSGRKPG